VPTLPGQIAGEVDAERGADTEVRELASGAEAVDRFAVDAEAFGGHARREQSASESLQH
jgi:hypothetical protein